MVDMKRSWMPRRRVILFREYLSFILLCDHFVFSHADTATQFRFQTPFFEDYEGHRWIDGWLFAEHAYGDVGAFEGLCVVEGSQLGE
jgi:hypothetical protein